MISAGDRVKIWNSFFPQAWSEARALRELQIGRPINREFSPLGGRLSEEQQQVLTLLAVCALAIEARSNHLMHILVEDGKLSSDQAESAQRLPLLDKWLLLPRLAGKRKTVDTAKFPHQSIAEIAGLRNAVVHTRFEKIAPRKLPNAKKMLTLFQGFVEAMEDMNVLLGRTKKHRKKVLEIGKVGTAV